MSKLLRNIYGLGILEFNYISQLYHCSLSYIIAQKQSPGSVLLKSAPRNFAKFTWKHLCRSLSLINLEALDCNFIKKETLTQVFSCQICEISESAFSYRRPLSIFRIIGTDAFLVYAADTFLRSWIFRIVSDSASSSSTPLRSSCSCVFWDFQKNTQEKQRDEVYVY